MAYPPVQRCKLRTLQTLAGLYIHIPYCRKACTYCNFHFTTGQSGRQEMMQAISGEYSLMAPSFQTPWQTVYFGGGTPSVIPAEQIAGFIDLVRTGGGIAHDAEITLEANPEDIHSGNLNIWKAAGINRLSLGVQSLDAEELRMMNRAHTSRQAKEAVELALKHGFTSLNIDLIFGSPWLTDENWQQHMQWAFSCGADHISAYALTVEEKTRLNRQISRGEITPAPDEKQARQYMMLQETADKEGWDFYEISNLSKPGKRARHNSSYWHNESYLGLGPSAHSYDGRRTRWWNIADNLKYLRALESGQPAREKEELSDRDLLNEYLLTHIRLSEGVDLDQTANIFPGWSSLKSPEIDSICSEELAITGLNRLRLTRKGRLFADHITALLML